VTTIDIDLTDPLVVCQRGETVHGDLDYEVPYMTEVVPGLWQGGCRNGLVLPDFIEHVVSLYPWERYVVNMPLTSYMEVAMHDDTRAVDGEQIEALARWVNACRKTGPTLVHCQAGLNRSGLIVASALCLDGKGVYDTIVHLRRIRSDAVLCNPRFVEHLVKEYRR
jgi:hypothetical protein